MLNKAYKLKMPNAVEYLSRLEKCCDKMTTLLIFIPSPKYWMKPDGYLYLMITQYKAILNFPVWKKKQAQLLYFV